jgi:hypothetical protein
VRTIYAVPLAHERKGINVGAICWGTCGKGAIGGIMLGEYGAAIPCNRPAAECPHHHEDIDAGMTVDPGDGTEAAVIIRLLHAEATP